MKTSFGSTTTLCLLTLVASGCGSLDPGGTTSSLERSAAVRSAGELARGPLTAPAARDVLTRTDMLAPVPGVLQTTTTTPPAEPPAPTDCHDGLSVVVPSSDWLRVLSFAGSFDSWAATYAVTSASGEETTHFVAFDAQGRPHDAPRPVPAGTRVASFRYEFLLVGPSVADPFFAVLDGRGREEMQVRDPAIWPATWGAELGTDASVLEVFATPNRCGYEATLLVGSAAGRSLLAVHRGSEGALTTEAILDLAPVPADSSSVLAVSATEVLEIVTPYTFGGDPHLRLHRRLADGWALASEIEAWAEGPSQPVAATRTWSGWSVLGTAVDSAASSEVVELRDDGTTSAPIAVAGYERCGSGLGSITSYGDTTLFAIGARIGGLHYGTVTAAEDVPLPSSLVAWQGSGDLAALGAGSAGLSVRCHRPDALRAPAP